MFPVSMKSVAVVSDQPGYVEHRTAAGVYKYYTLVTGGGSTDVVFKVRITGVGYRDQLRTTVPAAVFVDNTKSQEGIQFGSLQ